MRENHSVATHIVLVTMDRRMTVEQNDMGSVHKMQHECLKMLKVSSRVYLTPTYALAVAMRRDTFQSTTAAPLLPLPTKTLTRSRPHTANNISCQLPCCVDVTKCPACSYLPAFLVRSILNLYIKMQQIKTLEELALESIVKRINTIFIRLVKQHSVKFSFEESRNASYELHKTLVKWVPPVLDSKLTAILLTNLEKVYLNVPDSFRSGNMARLWIHIVYAVMLPRAERIGPVVGYYGDAKYTRFFNTKLPRLIEKSLRYMYNLKSLNLLMRTCNSTSLLHYVPRNLVEFYGILDDPLLLILIRRNPLLKLLVLRGSKRVTASNNMPKVETLEDLVLRDISRRINSILVRHLVSCDSVKFSPEETRNVAVEIRTMLIEWIPRSLGSKLTSLLLQNIDRIFIKHPGCFKYSSQNGTLQYMVQAVIHPNSERVGPVVGSSGRIFSRFYTKLPRFIENVLPSMDNLKILNLQTRKCTSICLKYYVPQNLSEFCGIVNDMFLQHLVYLNPTLRVLVIRNSKKITNRSVKYIVSLNHLEILDIKGTGIPSVIRYAYSEILIILNERCSFLRIQAKLYLEAIGF
ncbi:hypothetical protein C0J52_08134 [Blattella germanica]|nr:hypothetical protein C0J52_08134 [Blattella germanica]